VSAGRSRGLAQLAGARGAIALGALAGVEPSLRPLLCATLAPHLTAVALDGGTAAAASLAGALPGRCGLAVDVAEPPSSGEGTHLDAATAPAAARRLAASAGYLRLPLRPDDAAATGRQVRVAAVAAELCHAEELPLVLHVAVEPLAAADAVDGRRDELAAAAARAVIPVGADLVVAPLACGARLRRPWVCDLSALSAEDLEVELARACALGARGFALEHLLGGPGIDEHVLLGAAVPLVSALRAVAEECVAAPLAPTG
jgi:hypothetical protein